MAASVITCAEHLLLYECVCLLACESLRFHVNNAAKCVLYFRQLSKSPALAVAVVPVVNILVPIV